MQAVLSAFTRSAAPWALVATLACNRATGASADGGPSPSPTSSAGAAAATGSATPGSAPAGTTLSSFEGDLAMKMSGPQLPRPLDMTYEMKGDKTRFDMDAFIPGMPKMWGIVDRKENKIYTVLDAQKMVMVSDLDAAARAKQQQGPNGGYAIDKTGKTDTVAGQLCEIWNVTGNGTRTELCVVKGVQALPAGQLAGTPGAEVGWSVGLESEGALPLRAIIHDGTGKEIMRMDAVRFEKKTIDASRFVIPAGYKTINGPAPGAGANPFKH